METNKKKLPLKPIILTAVLLVGGYFGFKKIQFSVTHETTDNAQIETQIVPVLPRVSGYIKSLNIKDFDSVGKGQLLAEIDDAELQAQLDELKAAMQQASTEVVNAQATLQNAIATLSVSKGNITLSEVRRKKAEDDQHRDQQLLNDGAITRKQADDSHFNLETAQQQLTNSKSEYTSAQTRIAILNAGVQRAKDAVAVMQTKIAQVELKLSYTKILAPMGGKIGRKTISEGQYVQAGAPLFSIVNDSTFWVVANFKENQVEALTPGKKVELRVDAYPNLKITGTVASLSEATGAKFALLPPDNSSGNFVKVTQRVPIKIWIDNDKQYRDLLRAGMSVFVVAEK
jgi:membrane fusion protein (multidrug efflux system)